MKIAMVVGLFRPHGGGAERQAETLSVALAQRGLSIEVITLCPRGEPSRYDDDPVPATRLHAMGTWKLKEAHFVYRVYRHLLQTKPDIIHIHQAELLALGGVRAAQALGIPSLVKCGNSGERFDLRMTEKKYPFGKRIAQRIVAGTDRFVALSPDIRHDLLRYGAADDKIVEIPNGVTLPEPGSAADRERVREELRLPADVPVLITVGTLTPKKNQACLLNAIGAMPPAQRPYAVIVGGGPLREELEEQAKALGIADRIRLTGGVESSTVRRYLQAADLFVLPSLAEGLSNALLEAMACGLPATVSDIAANRNVLLGETWGRFFQPDNHDSLRSILDTFLVNRDGFRQMGQACRQRAEAEYGLPSVARRYEQLYQTLLASKREHHAPRHD